MGAGRTRGLVRTVAEELRNQVVPRHVGGFLPGTRILAQTLGVSVPTVCKALRFLGEEGVLEGGGNRRRWRVAVGLPVRPSGRSGKTKTAGGVRPQRLLFITSQPLSVARYSGVEVFAALLDKLAMSEWEVVYRVVDYQNARKPRRSWDELMQAIQPDALMVLSGTEVIGKWAMKWGIRTLFVGGSPGTSGVPLIRVSVAAMFREAAGHLLELGHRRIMFPLCGRPPSVAENVRLVADELTSAAGIPRDRLVVGTSPYSGPQIMIDLLRKQWRMGGPDALIFLDWREFIAAEGFLRSVGVLIPGDVSVIVLSHNSMMEWHQPPISHFEHPVIPLARAIARWVVNDRPARNTSASMEFKARWVSCQSVLARE